MHHSGGQERTGWRVLVLDYAAAGGRAPACEALYALLGKRFDLTVVGAELPRWRRLVTMVRTFRPNRVRWGKAYYRALELHTHTAGGFDEYTRCFQRAARKAKGRFDCILQWGALFGPVDLGYPVAYLTYHDGNMKITYDNWPPQAPFASTADFEAFFRKEQHLVTSVDRVLTYSERTRRSYVQEYGCAPEKVVTVGSADWVRLEDLGKLDFAPKAEKQYDGRTVLFVCSDYVRKGGDAALAAFRKVREAVGDARMVMVGQTQEAQVAGMPGVELVGTVHDRKRMHQLYQEAAVFLLPTRHDPFPRVVLEAMLNRVPCVVSDVGGVSEQVADGETGFVVPVDGVDAFAEKTIKLLREPELSRRMGEAGLQRVAERFAPQRVADRVASEIESATAARRKV